jgi:hypothetical protein
MALLLDRPPATIDDLTSRDSDLLTVAVAEGVDLTSKLLLAAADIGMEVETMLSTALPPQSQWLTRFPSLRHIAVTPQLLLWHTCLTLQLVYQDLYFSRLNDRYQAKMKLYRDEAARALDSLRINGLGIVYDPIRQALAPQVAIVQSAGAGGTMYVSVAFVNERGEEGLMSVPVEIDTLDGTAAGISIIALADNAAGWNLYAGVSPDQLTRQNDQTLDPLASATLVPERLLDGGTPAMGQRANMMYPVPRRLLRG